MVFKKIVCHVTLLATVQLSATIVPSEKPVSLIDNVESGLIRPEGLSFSPSGDCIAAANSEGNSITLYERIGKEGLSYKSTPMCQVLSNLFLNFAHDVAFSPCGKYIAAASRDSNAVIFYQRNKNGQISPKPCCLIDDEFTRMNKPSGISFSPVDSLIAVANRGNFGSLSIYKLIKNKGELVDVEHAFTIFDTEFRKNNLSEPHDCDFSPDGKLLAVVHKRWYKYSFGQAGLAIYERQIDHLGAMTLVPMTIKYFGKALPHCCTFHPSGKYIAVSLESEKIIFFERNGADFEQCAEINIDKNRPAELTKAIAFSPCGRSLAIATTSSRIFFFNIDAD